MNVEKNIAAHIKVEKEALNLKINSMNKKFYEIIYDCIASGQVSSDRIAKYFKDKGFYKYWKEKNGNVKKEIR